ncbi:response regulator transcription factor [Bradyrhizobium iriomotense]|nr:response regulator transcription factor [Bradyrhizobium iriomotense]
MSVLGQIRAVLPEGCRLQVRFAQDLPPAHSPHAHMARASRAPAEIPELTTRQRDILGLLALGLSNKEIGRKLSLSHFTVRNHISQVMRLLDVSTRQEVIARLEGLAFDALPVADCMAK